jgi:hypothetical protein
VKMPTGREFRVNPRRQKKILVVREDRCDYAPVRIDRHDKRKRVQDAACWTLRQTGAVKIAVPIGAGRDNFRRLRYGRTFQETPRGAT